MASHCSSAFLNQNGSPFPVAIFNEFYFDLVFFLRFCHCVLFLVTNSRTVILHKYYMDFDYAELVTEEEEEDDDDVDDDDDDDDDDFNVLLTVHPCIIL